MQRKCPTCKECLDFRAISDGTLEYTCYLCGKKYSLDLAKGLVLKGEHNDKEMHLQTSSTR